MRHIDILTSGLILCVIACSDDSSPSDSSGSEDAGAGVDSGGSTAGDAGASNAGGTGGSSTGGTGGSSTGGTGGSSGSTGSGGTGGAAGSAGSDGAAAATVRLSVTRNGTPVNATWVAYQDGDGAWTALMGTNGTYEFSSGAGRYGVVTVCTDATNTRAVAYAIFSTTAEFVTPNVDCFRTEDPARNHMSGTVNGLATGEIATVFAGPWFSQTINPSMPSYGLDVIGAGIHDVGAVRGTGTSVYDNFVANRVILSRGQAISSDQTRDFDFSTSGGDLTAHSATLAPLDGTETSITSGAALVTLDGTIRLGASTSTNFDYGGVPAAARLADDLHVVFGYTNNDTHSRSVNRHMASASDVGLILPPKIGTTATSIVATTPNIVVAADLPALGSADLVSLSAQTGSGVIQKVWHQFMSSGWLGSSTSVSMPDLSSAAGYDSDFGLIVTGAMVDVSVGFVEHTRGMAGNFSPSQDGDEMKGSSVVSQLAP